VDVGSAFRTSHNWLVLQGQSQYGIFRLDDSNAERVLETVEARTGTKVQRPSGPSAAPDPERVPWRH
jgi:hypothetical protein